MKQSNLREVTALIAKLEKLSGLSKRVASGKLNRLDYGDKAGSSSIYLKSGTMSAVSTVVQDRTATVIRLLIIEDVNAEISLVEKDLERLGVDHRA